MGFSFVAAFAYRVLGKQMAAPMTKVNKKYKNVSNIHWRLGDKLIWTEFHLGN